MTEFVQILESIGFPAALVIYLLYREDKRDKISQEERQELYSVIQKNTEALYLLKDQLTQTFAFFKKGELK